MHRFLYRPFKCHLSLRKRSIGKPLVGVVVDSMSSRRVFISARLCYASVFYFFFVCDASTLLYIVCGSKSGNSSASLNLQRRNSNRKLVKGQAHSVVMRCIQSPGPIKFFVAKLSCFLHTLSTQSLCHTRAAISISTADCTIPWQRMVQPKR